MFKVLSQYIITFCLTLTLVGCAATQDVKFRAYKQDKQRVDQNRQSGNGGCLMENCPDVQEHKKTREVLVFEFAKPVDATAPGTEVEEVFVTSSDSGAMEKTTVTTETKTIDLPDFSDEELFEGEPQASEATSFVDYTIEKDDTLQKISKKFYNSFSKWPRIYDANRNVISNPDVLSPGTVIRVPVE